MVTRVGSSREEVKLSGPVQLYTVPAPPVLEERLKVAPEQIGLGVADTVGVAGVAFTVIDIVPVAPVQVPTDAYTE